MLKTQICLTRPQCVKRRKKQGRKCTYKSNIEARSRNHRYRRKAISIIYSESVSLASVIQQAKRMRPIMLLTVASLTLNYVPPFINGTVLGKSLLTYLLHGAESFLRS